MKLLRTLLDRFDEPSSWAALATLLTGIGIQVEPGMWQFITYILAGGAGVLGFFLKESPKP